MSFLLILLRKGKQCLHEYKEVEIKHFRLVNSTFPTSSLGMFGSHQYSLCYRHTWDKCPYRSSLTICLNFRGQQLIIWGGGVAQIFESKFFWTSPARKYFFWTSSLQNSSFFLFGHTLFKFFSACLFFFLFLFRIASHPSPRWLMVDPLGLAKWCYFTDADKVSFMRDIIVDIVQMRNNENKHPKAIKSNITIGWYTVDMSNPFAQICQP